MKVQTSNKNNVNFTSNIRFITHEGFEKICKNPKTRLAGEMYSLGHLMEIKDIGATAKIRYCLGGVLRKISQKKDLLYHLIPRNYYESTWTSDGVKNYSKSRHLMQIKDELKKISNSEKLKTFLIGGLQKETLEEDCLIASRYSTHLLADLKDALIAKNIDYTIFFGQKTPYKDWYLNPNIFLAYNKKTDTYYVNVCEKESARQLTDILDPQKIKDHFKYIEVSDEDKVFVHGKHVPNEFWNIR